jgi:purine-binding chemotaxis protein CheW
MDDQLLIFTLAGESYGVGVSYIQSIMQLPPITIVPGAARSIEGVINLRSAMVPVVDLRARFELPPVPEGHKKVVVVIELGGLAIGMIVDRVTDVTKVSADLIEPPSPLLNGGSNAYVCGLARLGDRVIILLDLDRIFSLDEYQALKQAG